MLPCVLVVDTPDACKSIGTTYDHLRNVSAALETAIDDNGGFITVTAVAVPLSMVIIAVYICYKIGHKLYMRYRGQVQSQQTTKTAKAD